MIEKMLSTPPEAVSATPFTEIVQSASMASASMKNTVLSTAEVLGELGFPSPSLTTEGPTTMSEQLVVIFSAPVKPPALDKMCTTTAAPGGPASGWSRSAA
ncbi:hypothetical protein L6R49_22770 [Myxococcota bacterium]|nr:hypothetical protein [Myxococcota bacterium]